MTRETAGRSTQTTRHFIFSTQDFARCFSSPVGDFLSRQIYRRSRNYMEGEFRCSWKNLKQKKLGRCDIGITVPGDRSILFQMTGMNLPCNNGFLRIYESTNKRRSNRRLTYCVKDNKETPPTSLLVPSNTAVVTFVFKRFSPQVHVQVHFSAVSSYVPSLPDDDHRSLSVTHHSVHSNVPASSDICCQTFSRSNGEVSIVKKYFLLCKVVKKNFLLYKVGADSLLAMTTA